MLMECSCVAHGVLLRKLTKKGFVTSLQAEEQRLSSLIKVKYYAANLITLHCLELFRSSSNYSHKIFAGLGGTFTSSILTHAPNALVKKMIMLVFVPTIISDQSDADEYLQVFEKFIDAAFDSGFSEYFLSNIAFFKQILLTFSNTSGRLYSRSRSCSRASIRFLSFSSNWQKAILSQYQT